MTKCLYQLIIRRATRLTISLLLSLPGASLRVNVFSLAINSILLLAAADFITHPLRCPESNVIFARVGAVDHQSVKITVRYPHTHGNESSTTRILYREWTDSLDSERPWIHGPMVYLRQEDDWIATTRVTALSPNTKYQCKISHFFASRRTCS